jgi:hypothetical protein
LRDISRLPQLMPTTMHRCRLAITICRPPVDPTSAQPILVKSIQSFPKIPSGLGVASSGRIVA